MMKLLRSLVCVLPFVSLSTFASEASSVVDAVKSGSASLGFRYRLESVDQDGFSKNATASTLRTRLGFTTAVYNGWSLAIEVDDLSYLGDDDFNNTRNGQTMYPVVADPSGTDTNQLYLKYAGEVIGAKLGRQRINLDNQRFIGGVGWRQNEQTYDAFLLSTQGTDNLSVAYAYINRIARIFGPEPGTPAPTLDSNSHVLHVDYKAGDAGKLSAYAYLLDVENAAAVSNRTVGVRYTNVYKRDAFSVPFTLEFARQADYGDNPASYSANYYVAELGLKFESFGVLIANEVLEGDQSAGTAFITPLATLHKFQGWADKFLATPAGGIDDRYVTLTANLVGNGINVTWHNFESDVGSVDYGSELDLSVSRKLTDNLGLLLKYADYDADTFSADTRKLWLMLTVSF